MATQTSPRTLRWVLVSLVLATLVINLVLGITGIKPLVAIVVTGLIIIGTVVWAVPRWPRRSRPR
jgi:hypothetical protein